MHTWDVLAKFQELSSHACRPTLLAFLLTQHPDDTMIYGWNFWTTCGSCMIPNVRTQVKYHYSTGFPFFACVLPLHIPTRLTKKGSSALQSQSHSNNSAAQELFWIENRAIAALEDFLISSVWSSDTSLWTLILRFTCSLLAVPQTSLLYQHLNTLLCLSYYFGISPDPFLTPYFYSQVFFLVTSILTLATNTGIAFTLWLRREEKINTCHQSALLPLMS